ncbi:V-type ATP synthase subunit D [Demequina lutea]|uniref:Vacuolar-type H+-ATPase subunit D/Vma8 n=1 Tax=Demequina lutea TaxID=431489 RepID=A0A7Y9ZCB1_9MICO|nr:V-type ATP synthase subunit D [Demequina lutea]NYI42003.1 vacuolar-type H+-ATPase subunit D/Vma8 [Demequina lutea]
MADTGRAGRVRLERRLTVARHGADLLDRKQRILADELERLKIVASHSDARWQDLAAVAATWLRRAAALDGRAQIAATAPRVPARVEVTWGGAMGVAFPLEASGMSIPPTTAGGSSALSFAVAAHAEALEAAVEQAVATRAVQLVSAELAATRSRLHAVEKRWIPRLEDRLMAIRRALDALELEESLRLRWAAGAAGADARPSVRSEGS